MWHQFIAEDAVAGGYASCGRHEHTDVEICLACVKGKAAKRAIFN